MPEELSRDSKAEDKAEGGRGLREKITHACPKPQIGKTEFRAYVDQLCTVSALRWRKL